MLKTVEIEKLNLLPTIPGDAGLKSTWQPGEEGAEIRLNNFIKNSLANYSINRDRPDLNEAVSHLSPHLHFGEISPLTVWHAAPEEPFLRQLGWREFADYILYHFPTTIEKPLKAAFAHLNWEENMEFLKKWEKGITGYPIVDAGMRQLWGTGWMHNRVRMIVGSFLVKDLLLTWQEGEKWFWDTLVDADMANNCLGWQWVAGCGADAAPFFRIFNPIKQGEKFDPQGKYVRTWVPELQALPNEWIHRPWEAPAALLKQSGIILGQTYPFPIVSRAIARQKALSLYTK